MRGAAIVLGFLVAGFVALDVFCVEDVYQRFRSSRAEDRAQAKNEVLSARNLVISSLIALINEKGNEDAQWEFGSTQVKTAVEVLGEMRAAEAAETLAKFVEKGKYGKELGPGVVGLALVKIGKPSVQAVLARVRASTDQEVIWSCCEVIRGVEGKDLGPVVLRLAMEREDDPGKRRNLERALNFLRSR